MSSFPREEHKTIRFTSLATTNAPFITEEGDRLEQLDLAYETWGTLNTARDNAILIFHALTGDSHVASHQEVEDDDAGWWEPVVGPGRAIDTDRFFVICANAPGSCYGSTGPASIAPDDKPYATRFPKLTIRDMTHIQIDLARKLGALELAAVIGGSVGGMEAIEAPLIAPDFVRRAVVIAASNRFHDQGIAFNEVQRRSIMLDPAWNGGDYDPDAGPHQGLAIARMLGMITYQCDQLMTARFHRQPARYDAWPEFHGRYDVEGYLQYQGDKLASRFDANSYLYLTRAMDSHDIGRDRGGLLTAASRIRCECLFVGISSDVLFPPEHIEASAGIVRQTGGSAHYVELETPHGHDAFLKDFDLLGPVLKEFMASYPAVSPSSPLPRNNSRASANPTVVTANKALNGPRIPREWKTTKKAMAIDAK